MLHCEHVSVPVAMPSITPEPFGRVALEAQAMGRPVVAFDQGGATESIRHGETGWLAVPGDADSLAVALQAALDLTPRKRKTLATTARQYIEANFSTELRYLYWYTPSPHH